MTTTITYEDAKRTLEELADERPDYIYESPNPEGNCVYRTPDGSPSCIVGHLLNRLHPEDFERIAVYDRNEQAIALGTVEINDDTTAHEAVGALGIQIEHNTKILLAAAQENQDSGIPWGPSVAKAILRVEGV